MQEWVETALILAIPLLGAGTLIGVFCRMNTGFGPFNLRAVGIVFGSTMAALLALKEPAALNSAMALLAAMVGYLFGIGNDQSSEANNRD